MPRRCHAALTAALALLAGAPAADALPTRAHATAAAALAEREAALPTDDVVDCLAPPGDPAPGTAEWRARDVLNQHCATLRVRDQLLSPGYGWANLTQGARLWLDRTAAQLGDLGRPRGGLTTLVPGSQAADAYRTIERWTEAGRGRAEPIAFGAANGATLRGHVFAPPATVPRPKDGFPGVVITDGSVQAYEELYFWAAQDLAEAGYLVMTYDVQGQGDSDLLGADCPGPCSGVPYQQSFNFHQGAEDSLSAFLGERNPFADLLDPDRVGIAGHSLGASAVSQVGQCDRRVRAVVAWDNLRPVDGCDGVTIAGEHRSAEPLRTPALGIANDYGFTPQPAFSAPDREAKLAASKQLAAAGTETGQIVLRGATHLEYSYIPLVLPASRKGERFASYYTRAWFDRHLKGDPTAGDRLRAATYDASVDATSIGTGTYDPARAAEEPGDRFAGNVPYRIQGVRTANALSFYYRSALTLKGADCPDLRAGC